MNKNKSNSTADRSFSKALLFWLFVLIIFFPGCTQKDDFSVLKGPYLGQTPPGTEPEIFAPGLITTHYSQTYIAFLNEARVCVYSASTDKGHETFYTYEKNGHWTTPQRASFEELQGHPNYTMGPHGRKVYFHSGRPTHPDDTREDDNIWTIEWTGSDWAEPQALPAPANSDFGEAYPSATADGTVYFFTWRREGTRGDDIWVSRYVNGQYQEAERLPWPLNTDFIEYDPYIAPDESFLIFGSDRPGGFGKSDNYICFRKEDGSWTFPINLGRPLNSSSWDLCANGTPDRKYFFFTSGRKTDVYKGHIGKKSGEEPAEDSDLYWVDFSFINDLKNTVFTKLNAAEIIKLDYEENGIQSAVDTLNKLHSDEKDSTYFPPFELLSLCKNMIVENKTGDADLFFMALSEVLPNDFLMKEGYARFCAMNGHVSKGMKILEELESEDPSFDLSDSLSSLGYLFTLYPDKTEDALSVLLFTVEKFPEDPWAYFSLARVYRQLGDLDKAIENCRKSLEINPSVGDVSQLLERLLKEQEEKEADNQQKETFPVLKGPYLGQKPPGKTPEIFAPGIVCTEKNEGYLVFLDHGRVLVFDRWLPQADESNPYLLMEMRDGRWTSPRPSPHPQNPHDPDLPIAPDGRTLFFALNRAADGKGESETGWDIWMTKWTGHGFSPIRRLETPVSSEKRDAWASLAQNGNLYFMSNRDDSYGRWDIYKAEYEDGGYMNVQNIGLPVNSEVSDADPAIAPDESYLLFCSQRPDGFGKLDLYITFRKQNGSWSTPQNMGTGINTPASEEKPYVTPDGKYLFFSNDAPGNLEIYWVDAKIIDDLKPDELR